MLRSMGAVKTSEPGRYEAKPLTSQSKVAVNEWG